MSQPRLQIARRLFLSALGLIFLIAFASLLVQLRGLIGTDGILPAGEFLSWARARLGSGAWIQVPTLFWVEAGDVFLEGTCVAGMLLSALLMVGFGPRWTLLALWFLYLSFESVGGVFLSYQWDILLLEAAVMGLFVAPSRLAPSRAWASPVWPGGIWLVRWLLFRLMVLSGLVKLLSGDETWRRLTALRFHYWTQPLPNPISFFAAHLPNAAQTFSAALMFVVELLVPWMIFVNARTRLWAAAILIGFQLSILLTGNYGFFNLLAIALCFVLLDDEQWSRLLPKPLGRRIVQSALPPTKPVAWIRGTRIGIAALLVLLSFGEMRFWRRRLPGPIEDLLAALEPFRSINSYGLFAVMTTARPEILVEGSRDGQDWRTYEFKWKPGPVDEIPKWVAPHQPRLDWQMWFAALGSCRHNPWFLRFQKRLLEGSPAVLSLLKGNPFPAAPPKYVRSVVYRYQPAEIAEWRGDGHAWKRELEGSYCPSLALEDGNLVAPSMP